MLGTATAAAGLRLLATAAIVGGLPVGVERVLAVGRERAERPRAEGG